MTTQADLSTITQFVSDYAESINAGKAGAFLGFDEDNLYQIERIAHQVYAQGRHQRARDLLEGLISLDSSRHYAHLLLGDVLLRLGDYPAALTALQRADHLSPQDTHTRAKLGEVHAKLGERERAIALLGEVAAKEETGVASVRARALLRVLTAQRDASA